MKKQYVLKTINTATGELRMSKLTLSTNVATQIRNIFKTKYYGQRATDWDFRRLPF